MMKYYDKKGRELKDVLAWARLLDDTDYVVVKQDEGAGDLLVSTVWVGLDRRMPYEQDEGRPLIFESAVFLDHKEMESAYYCTYEEALAGHAELVKKWVRSDE